MNSHTFSRVLTVSLGLWALWCASAVAQPIGHWSEITASDADNRDKFGSAVAIYGDQMVIGARGWQEPGSGSRNHGCVYVFKRDSNGVWTQTAQLVPSEANDRADFGFCVDIFEDVIAVSQPWAAIEDGDAPQHRVFIFRQRADGQWIEEAQLLRSDECTAPRGQCAEALAMDRNLLVVGSKDYPFTGGQRGKVSIFRFDGAGWAEEAAITEPRLAAAKGHSVAVSGDTIAFGAPATQVWPLNEAGEVHVLRRSGSDWISEAVLHAPIPKQSAFFGESVSLESDTLAIAAWREPVDGMAFAGAVYVYQRTGTTWTFMSRMTAQAPAKQYMYLGQHLVLCGDEIAASQPGDNNNRGSIQIFRKTGADWRLDRKLAPAALLPGDVFGGNAEELGRNGFDMTPTALVGGSEYHAGAQGNEQGIAFALQRGAGPILSVAAPNDPLVHVPDSTIQYIVTVSNPDAYRITGTLWVEARDSNQNGMGPEPAWGPNAYSLAPGETVDFSLSFTIPSDASPGGDNALIAKCGEYPGFPPGWIEAQAALSFDIVLTPLITRQPEPVTVCEGDDARFEVAAVGIGTLHYSWRVNGAPSGEDSSTLLLPSRSLADSGATVDCLVYDDIGNRHSDQASLSVIPNGTGPIITTQPADESVCPGETAEFFIAATGTGALAFEWAKNGVNVGTGNSLVLENVQFEDNGSAIECTVIDDCGVAVSRTALLSVVSGADECPVCEVELTIARKYVSVNNDDDDEVDIDGDDSPDYGDGIIDYDDGFKNRGPNVVETPNATRNNNEDDFVRVSYTLNDQSVIPDPSLSLIRFRFQGSYRLWTRPGNATRDWRSVLLGGDRIVPSESIPGVRLGLRSDKRSGTLYLEALSASAQLDAPDLLIVDVDPDGVSGPVGFTCSDTAEIVAVNLGYERQTLKRTPPSDATDVINSPMVPIVSTITASKFYVDPKKSGPSDLLEASNEHRLRWTLRAHGLLEFWGDNTGSEFKIGPAVSGVPLDSPGRLCVIQPRIDGVTLTNPRIDVEAVSEKVISVRINMVYVYPLVLQLGTVDLVMSWLDRANWYSRQAGVRIELENGQAVGDAPTNGSIEALANGVFKVFYLGSEDTDGVFDPNILTGANVYEGATVRSWNRAPSEDVINVYIVPIINGQFAVSNPESICNQLSTRPESLVLSQSELDSIEATHPWPGIMFADVSTETAAQIDAASLTLVHELGHMSRLKHTNDPPKAPTVVQSDGRNIMYTPRKPERISLTMRQAQILRKAKYSMP